MVKNTSAESKILYRSLKNSEKKNAINQVVLKNLRSISGAMAIIFAVSICSNLPRITEAIIRKEIILDLITLFLFLTFWFAVYRKLIKPSWANPSIMIIGWISQANILYTIFFNNTPIDLIFLLFVPIIVATFLLSYFWLILCIIGVIISWVPIAYYVCPTTELFITNVLAIYASIHLSFILHRLRFRNQVSLIEALSSAEIELIQRRETEIQLAQRAKDLERSNQELQSFAYVASHDLQEPLRKVITFSNIVLEKVQSKISAEAENYIVRMHNSALRMKQLIEGLLSYSRITTEAKSFKEVNLNEILEEVVSDLEISINETSGKINYQKLPTIQADALQMHQLFQNLIGNALKYHSDQDKPVVRINSHLFKADLDVNSVISEKAIKICEIIVKDNGIGFEQKSAENIFKIFHRLHGKNDKYYGTGVGLAICRKIVERHDGTISVKSSPGKGAIFSIKLPLKQIQS